MKKPWHTGVVFIGLIAVCTGTYAFIGVLASQHALVLGTLASMILVTSGLGLIARQKWAYILILIFCAIMLFGAFTYLLDRKEIRSPGIYILLIGFFLLTIIYLLIPPVWKDFFPPEP